MTESDEWATVETVVDEELDSNHHETIHKQGPSGIEQGILEKSRLTCMVSVTLQKLYLFLHIFAVLFILSNTNPWLLLFIVVGIYYLVQKFWFSSQRTSSDEYSTFSKNQVA
jgi:hypothetical protein